MVGVFFHIDIDVESQKVFDIVTEQLIWQKLKP